MPKIITWVVCCGLLISCATGIIPDKSIEKMVLNLTGSLNPESIGTVLSRTRVPFLLDTEIITAEEDLQAFWSDYVNAGFALADTRVVEIKKVKADTYLEFGTGKELQIFFQKYIPRTAYLAKISSADRLFVLIIVPEQEALPAFYAFKGAGL